MTTRTTQIPFDELLERAAAESCRRRREALPPEEVLRREHDFSALDRRMAAWLKQQRRARAEKTMPRRTSLRTLKRIALAAALLAALFLGALTVSAELRAYVKEVIVYWGERNMDLRYEVDGHQLTELPEGYGPHYIPEGYVYNDENSFLTPNQIILDYENEDGYFIQVTITVAENGSGVVTDSEHITYEYIDFGEADAYFGTFNDGDGYVMYWFADGMEHELFINAYLPESEVYAIAEHID